MTTSKIVPINRATRYAVDDFPDSLDDMYAAKYAAWIERRRGGRGNALAGAFWAIVFSLPGWIAIGIVVWAMMR